MIKAWLFVKKYWQLLLLIASVVIGFIVFRRRDMTFAEDYRKINEAHRQELDKIEKARAEERRKSEENQRRLEATLAEVKKRYDEKEKQFDAKKKAEIEEIVKKHGDDPVELARRLSASTGFTIILPEDP